MDITPPEESQKKRFFFIHIQKTAGTSIREHLMENFDRSEVYPPLEPGGLPKVLARYVFGQKLVDTPAAEQAKYQLFNGHMPYAVSQRLAFDTPPSTMTVLRDPVARTLSVLGQKRRHRPEFANATLEDIYDNSAIYTGEILNHQTKVFAVPNESNLLSGFDPFPVGLEQLELAKKNLNKVDVIGLESDIPSFLAELERKFGWPSLLSGARKNVGDRREVNPIFLERIAADNAIDMAFYRYAIQLVKSRAL
jgi:hypothetical protein